VFDPSEKRGDLGHGLEKSVWTDADFGRMGWHESHVRAIALLPDDEDDFAGRLLIDLDYIVRWAGGHSPGEAYTFWIAPATLVFHGVYELEGSLQGTDGEVWALTREAVDDTLGYDRWALEADVGLVFRAAGFRQIMRREPMHVHAQSLTPAERGGLSFSELPYDAAASELATTHADNPPAERRIDAAARAPAPGPPDADELKHIDWQIAHLTLWRHVYELYLDELGAPPEGRRAPADLASPSYRALGDGVDVLAQDRDDALRMARTLSGKATIRHAREEVEQIVNDIQELTDRRDHPGAAGTAGD
jgi:hypothetical protein